MVNTEKVFAECMKDRSLTLDALAQRLNMTIGEARQFVEEMRQKGYSIRLWVPVD